MTAYFLTMTGCLLMAGRGIRVRLCLGEVKKGRKEGRHLRQLGECRPDKSFLLLEQRVRSPLGTRASAHEP
jgi:hypothetical protein